MELLSPQEIVNKTKKVSIKNNKAEDEDHFGFEDDFQVIQAADKAVPKIGHAKRYIKMDELYGKAKGFEGIPKVRDERLIHKRAYVNTGKVPLGAEKIEDRQDIYDNFVHAHYITDPMTHEPEMFISAQSPTDAGIFKFLSMIHFKKNSPFDHDLFYERAPDYLEPAYPQMQHLLPHEGWSDPSI